MPLYEYRCASCGKLTEALQRLGEAPLTKCPHCGGALERLISAPALQFKGSGWYVTDYGRGGGTGSKAKTESGDAAKTESTSAESTPKKTGNDAAKAS